MGGSSSVPLSRHSEQIKTEVNEHPVVVYTKDYCPYCVRAEKELNELDIKFVEKNLNEKAKADPANVEAYVKGLMDLTHQKTVPQIFVCGRFIGGYTEMHAQKKNLLKMVAECSTDGVAVDKTATVRPKL
ncbi:unnamed protein product [Auanema sp. JU1783]|nr:unnamed protein product [Auanema sp. JU1783]